MSMVVTITRTDTALVLSLSGESTGEFFRRIRSLFSDLGKRAIDEALGQRDEKLALVGVLLYAVRPEMEENGDLVEVEEEILARVGDNAYIAEMEALNEQKRILEAMVEGASLGMKAGVRALTSRASTLVRQMDGSLKSLKGDVALFHDERKKAIQETTARISALRKQEELELARAESVGLRAHEAGKTLVQLQRRVGAALDQVDELKWKV